MDEEWGVGAGVWAAGGQWVRGEERGKGANETGKGRCAMQIWQLGRVWVAQCLMLGLQGMFHRPINKRMGADNSHINLSVLAIKLVEFLPCALSGSYVGCAVANI